jgi:hypothetical protein
MKKYLSLCLVVSVCFALISWGSLGHHVVGEIAENHLTPKAEAAVKALLRNQSLADVSSWADEVRSQRPETAPLHFLNLPLGLTFPEFEKQVESMSNGNVYAGILKAEQDLKDESVSRDKKVEALKFLVHFVGDAHQPMHVSRAEDKGGNSIKLTYNTANTNLHSIWDSKLIEQDGTDYKELAKKYDQATPAEIKKWQSDPIIMWVWESYQISSQLYAEVDSIKDGNVGESYYAKHIPIVENRIEKAGIRLSGLLNNIFANVTITITNNSYPPPVIVVGSEHARVELSDIANHIGEPINVTATVADFKEFGDLLLINMGAPYPDSPLTLVFKGNNKALGEQVKAKGTKLLIVGTPIEYKGKPEIEVTQANQILVPPSN